ncbi:hypothetical protein C3495_09945 [Clostridiaceae bacterium 14S0207]|nr:hypothetical protein C3495_09945 [Clostridiaceae bacterium 14S0207]
MIYVYIQNKKYLKKIQYVFDNVFFNLGLEYKYIYDEVIDINDEDILVTYSFNDDEIEFYDLFKNHIDIKDSLKLFNDDYYMKYNVLTNIEIKKVRLYDKYDLISLFSKEKEVYLNILEDNENTIYKVNFDVISDIFFMLTRYEEIINYEVVKNEVHNRFPAVESIAFKNNFLHRPIVNEDIDFLWDLIDNFKLGLERKEWWGKEKFAVCLTHDVDMVFKYLKFKKEIRNSARYLLKEGSLNKSIKNFILFFKSKLNYKNDPYWNIEDILKLEKDKGFKSSFYFMSGGTSKVDNYYDIEDPRIQNLIKFVEDNGFEAGYHASFNSYNNFKLMKSEKEKLDTIISSKQYGCRQHYLRFAPNKTWKQHEQLKLKYDASLGYADRQGFRCGYCFPFKPYDIVRDEVLNIWEIPLTIMDVTLAGSNYSNLTVEEGVNEIKQYINTIEKHRGVFNILWHNSSFDTLNTLWKLWENVYGEVLEYISCKGVLATSGQEILRNIQENNEKIMEEVHEIRI